MLPNKTRCVSRTQQTLETTGKAGGQRQPRWLLLNARTSSTFACRCQPKPSHRKLIASAAAGLRSPQWAPIPEQRGGQRTSKPNSQPAWRKEEEEQPTNQPEQLPARRRGPAEPRTRQAEGECGSRAAERPLGADLSRRADRPQRAGKTNQPTEKDGRGGPTNQPRGRRKKRSQPTIQPTPAKRNASREDWRNAESEAALVRSTTTLLWQARGGASRPPRQARPEDQTNEQPSPRVDESIDSGLVVDFPPLRNRAALGGKKIYSLPPVEWARLQWVSGHAQRCWCDGRGSPMRNSPMVRARFAQPHAPQCRRPVHRSILRASLRAEPA